VDLEAEDENGFTALMYAANAGQEQIVELLARQVLMSITTIARDPRL
jgi:ankyrin repeat protein